MPASSLPRAAAAAALAACIGLHPSIIRADFLSDIGVTHLRAVNPTLTGTGISVAQPESTDTSNNVDLDDFEVAPTSLSLGPSITITYINSSGNTATTFPNSVGISTAHPNNVARIFYSGDGIAPTLSNVFNYNANYFLDNIIINTTNGTLDPTVRIINQSFIIGDAPSVYNEANQLYDDFVTQHTNVLIVSGVGNGPNAGMTQVQAPATAYNVISVGALEINPGSSGTPTGDGRTKVDITAPSTPFGFPAGTSFSTPMVSGVAVLLEQAGSLGLAGAGTQTAAADARTLKSILLTGATKPAGWSHTTTNPLDAQWGSGIVNAYGSYRVLTGGMYAPSSTNFITRNAAHPAVTTGTPVGNTGWAYQNNISTTSNADAVNHFVLTLPASGFNYILTATLTWNRPYDSYSNINNGVYSGINNLDLFLYNGSNAITSSVSTLDNVEQIYLPSLAAGTYDMQVLKHGGFPNITAGVVSSSESYALSWSVQLVGDVNWDGVVDIADLTTIANNWQENERGIFNGDLNGDGIVDQADLDIVAANWQSGSTGNPGVAMPALQSLMVPEPATVAVLLAGAAGMLVRRKRRGYS